MTIFLGTWVMLFAALFLAYGVVRVQAGVWPPPQTPTLPLGLPGLATLILVGSSLVLRGGLRAARGGAPRTLTRALVTALALGLAFLALQAVVWREVAAAGLRPSSGTYGSVFFAFTIFHALHVGSGLILLGILTVRVARGRYQTARPTPVRLAAAFWDFVAVVWILMYLTVYLL